MHTRTRLSAQAEDSLCEPARTARRDQIHSSTDTSPKRSSKDERYQFLQKALASEDGENEGPPELGVDFKRYFPVPTDELDWRGNSELKGRCRLVSPYLEHFCSRFSGFMNRVALPAEHLSDP